MFGKAPQIALWMGLLILLVGMISRYIIGMRGAGTLLTGFFGLPIAMLGFMAMDPQYARRSMQGVTILALLGLLITVDALPLLNDLLLGQQPPGSTTAIIANSVLTLLCGALLLVCITSFISAWYKRLRR